MSIERSTYCDPLTGIEIIQLTNYKGHSHHFYFTNPGWYDNGRRLLFGSDRADRTNLFGIELASGEITQITNIDPQPAGFQFIDACKNPCREEVYFWIGTELTAVDLVNGQLRTIWQLPPRWQPLMLNAISDGRHLCFSSYQKPEQEFETDLLRGYVGFRDLFEARPLSRIFRVSVDTGEVETVYEERVWIGHVNTSPINPGQLTYCHEGPWEKVDHRIWGLDLTTGRAWKIAPPGCDYYIGHEFWHRDGKRIGFHGFRPGKNYVIGAADFDGSDGWLEPQPVETGHIFSFDDDLVVGDGYEQGVIKLWKRDRQKMMSPMPLCRHDSTAKIQQLHVHPRFTPDGKSVLFTSDRRTGYGNIYLAPLPDRATSQDINVFKA
jgi:oligogalacturonide lyase